MITDGKTEKFQELVDSYLDREQTVEGHEEVRKRLYQELPKKGDDSIEKEST